MKYFTYRKKKVEKLLLKPETAFCDNCGWYQQMHKKEFDEMNFTCPKCYLKASWYMGRI